MLSAAIVGNCDQTDVALKSNHRPHRGATIAILLLAGTGKFILKGQIYIPFDTGDIYSN